MKNTLSLALCALLFLGCMTMSNQAFSQEKVETNVDEMPVPPGGMDGLIKHMSQELKYPKEAKKAGIEGMVMVTFIVKSDGTVEAVDVLRGIGGGCDQEAVRVVASLAKWTAGIKDGKSVSTQMTLPINFKL